MSIRTIDQNAVEGLNRVDLECLLFPSARNIPFAAPRGYRFTKLNPVYVTGTNDEVLKNLMENGIRQGDGQTLGKTIIFARNHDHAILLSRRFDKLYPQYAGKFCAVIRSGTVT